MNSHQAKQSAFFWLMIELTSGGTLGPNGTLKLGNPPLQTYDEGGAACGAGIAAPMPGPGAVEAGELAPDGTGAGPPPMEQAVMAAAGTTDKRITFRIARMMNSLRGAGEVVGAAP
jgi:hypothetical protein